MLSPLIRCVPQIQTPRLFLEESRPCVSVRDHTGHALGRKFLHARRRVPSGGERGVARAVTDTSPAMRPHGRLRRRSPGLRGWSFSEHTHIVRSLPPWRTDCALQVSQIHLAVLVHIDTQLRHIQCGWSQTCDGHVLIHELVAGHSCGPPPCSLKALRYCRWLVRLCSSILCSDACPHEGAV